MRYSDDDNKTEGRICSYNLKQTGYEGLERTFLIRNRRQWRNVVNREINLRFPYKA